MRSCTYCACAANVCKIVSTKSSKIVVKILRCSCDNTLTKSCLTLETPGNSIPFYRKQECVLNICTLYRPIYWPLTSSCPKLFQWHSPVHCPPDHEFLPPTHTQRERERLVTLFFPVVCPSLANLSQVLFWVSGKDQDDPAIRILPYHPLTLPTLQRRWSKPLFSLGLFSVVAPLGLSGAPLG